MPAPADFTLDLADIVEEAFERASGGTRAVQTGYDYRMAIRSMNILFMEWANRGINMWTLDQGSIPLQKGLAGYQLPADTVDVIEYSIRTRDATKPTDMPIQRIPMPSYAKLANKTLPGKPQQIFVQRLHPYPVVTLWPVPDRDDYELVLWRLRRIGDADAPGSNTPDIPFRFVPPLISGLAYHLATKLPEGAARAEPLRAVYEQDFLNAAEEDRDRSTTRFVPRMY